VKTMDRRRAVVRWTAAALVAITALAACGGDDDDDAADETTTTEEETTTTELDEAAATEEIDAALVAFFAALGEGDLDGAIPLLQNGEDYRARMEHCKDLTLGAAAEPKTAEFTDDETATLTFDILLDGAVVLAGAGGGAVNVDGEWLVSENTFLSLYDAAKDGCTGPPPPEG
jgi:hypothetical protein